MRFLAITIAALSLSATASGGTVPTTSLTIVALNSWVGRAVFHLRCDPAGGDIPSPAKACDALARQPELVTNPKPYVCRGGPSSHWLVRITGPMKEQRVNLNFSTCWTLQMPTLEQFGLTWAVLKRHLAPRRHGIVPAGKTLRFSPGVLRAADLVSCNILGQHLSVGVPVEAGRPTTVGPGETNPVVLAVTLNRDGSVTASCHRWKRPKLQPAPSRSPLPEDVALSLPLSGVEVRDAAEVNRVTLPVTGRRAVRIARRNFGVMARPYGSGWSRVARTTVHLVRVVRSNGVGPLGLFPDQLVWLVVIRDATVPNLGPPGNAGPRSFNAMLGVFVRTDVPRWIVGTTF